MNFYFQTSIVRQFCCFSGLLQLVVTSLPVDWGLTWFFFPSKELLTIFSLRFPQMPFQVPQQVRPDPHYNSMFWKLRKADNIAFWGTC